MKQKITSLTGLRFVFVTLLVLHHFDMFYDLPIEGYDQIMLYFAEGFISVDFFFVLSGFVISYAYLSKMKNEEISSGSFLSYRLFKLYPVYFITWVGALLIYGGKDYFLQNLLSKKSIVGLFMLQSYIPLTCDQYAFWGNAVAWSVSTELFFYIAFIWLVRLKKREQAQIFAFLLGIVLLCSFIIGNDSPVAGWFYYVNPSVRLLNFLAGMLLYQWWEASLFRPRDMKSATILELISIGVLLYFILVSINSPAIAAARNPKLQGYYYLLPCVLLIFAFSYNMGLFSRLFSTKLFQILGNCSFAIYLTHQVVLNIVKRLWGSYIVDVKTMCMFGMVGFIISIAVAILLHYAVEGPAYRYLRGWWDRRTSSAMSRIE